jgi:CRP-like cAMP-binding protein
MQGAQVELLQGMPIFGAIREDTLLFLLEQARSIDLPAGEFFFHEGDEATGMYVLKAGRVAVIRHWNNKGLVLRQLGAGDCFGEMALMDLMPRSASVKATEPCSAIELRPEHLLSLFARDAEQFALIQMNMGREISRRLRAIDELLFRSEMQSRGTAPDLIFRAI